MPVSGGAEAKRAGRGLGGVAVLLAPLTACSWLAVSKPPDGPIDPTADLHCTESMVAPAADTAGALVFGALGTLAMYELVVNQCKNPGDEQGPMQAYCAALGLPALAFATAYGFSAVYGFKHAARCLELVETKNACVRGEAAACQILLSPAAPEPRPRTPEGRSPP